MNREMERKFLITYNNAIRLIKLAEDTEVRFLYQKYISFYPEIRVREEFIPKGKEAVYTLTIKSNEENNRKEMNIPIDKEYFIKEVEQSGGRDINSVSKTRYVLNMKDLKFEVDFFGKGLVLVEVEFNSQIRMDSFIPPSYFGKEVTMDYKYKNRYLIEKEEEKYVVKW